MSDDNDDGFPGKCAAVLRCTVRIAQIDWLCVGGKLVKQMNNIKMP